MIDSKIKKRNVLAGLGIAAGRIGNSLTVYTGLWSRIFHVCLRGALTSLPSWLNICSNFIRVVITEAPQRSSLSFSQVEQRFQKCHSISAQVWGESSSLDNQNYLMWKGPLNIDEPTENYQPTLQIPSILLFGSDKPTSCMRYRTYVKFSA